MGYNTDFDGSFVLDRPLTEDQRKYLQMFSDSRRMCRKTTVLNEMRKNNLGNAECFRLLEKLGMSIGGEFYCSDGIDSSISDSNKPPIGQPGLWCQWFPNDDGTEIFAEGEKFYEYVKWLQFIIDNFLKPWGHVIDGAVSWSGDDVDDVGVIEVIKNVITVHEGITKKAFIKMYNREPVSKAIPVKPKKLKITMDDIRAQFGCDVEIVE